MLVRSVFPGLARSMVAFLVFGAGLMIAPCPAQEGNEVNEFLQRGAELYKKRSLLEAVVEFENVLLLDPANIDAQLWLVRTYADLKQVRKARDLFGKVRKLAPDHAQVKELMKLFGEPPAKPKVKEGDLVMHETLTLLGSGTAVRQYGLVIPETKVKRHERTEITLEGDGKAPDADSLSAAGLDGKDLSKFDADEGPLSEAFDLWASDGLSAGLMRYFEVVLKDRSLGSLDDHKILEEGAAYFRPRFTANPADEEARFFIGMIEYLNGNIDQAIEQLEPLRQTDKSFRPLLEPVFAEMDKRKAEEEARKLALKREEEEKERLRQQALEAAAAASATAMIEASAASGTMGPAAVGNALEQADNEGYEMYKKGQLDQAIEKFNTSIKGNPKEPKYYYHLGLAYTDKGLGGALDSFDRAIEAFNRVIQLDNGGKMAKDAEVMIRDLVSARNTMKN